MLPPPLYQALSWSEVYVEGIAADTTFQRPYLTGKPHARQLQNCCFSLLTNLSVMPKSTPLALSPELEPVVLRRVALSALAIDRVAAVGG